MLLSRVYTAIKVVMGVEAAGLEPANPGVANPEPFQRFAPIAIHVATKACGWSSNRVQLHVEAPGFCEDFRGFSVSKPGVAASGFFFSWVSLS